MFARSYIVNSHERADDRHTDEQFSFQITTERGWKVAAA